MQPASCVIVFAALLLVLAPLSNSLTIYNLEVGAFGEAGSIGNIGVRVEIRTHIYSITPPDLDDSFWIADNLPNGAGIQFGYELLLPGTYCMKGEAESAGSFTCTSASEVLNGSQAVWFWEYFPNITANGYYFEIGSMGSAALNGTWRSYTIMSGSRGGWDFLLDGTKVATASFPSAKSISRALFVAEKVTSSVTPGALGPVEFRNLAYLKEDGWHTVTKLYAIVNCGVSPSCVPIPYGIALLGPNDVLAGTSVSQPKDGELIWDSVPQSGETNPSVSTGPSTPNSISADLLYSLLVVAIIAIAIKFVSLSRRHTSKTYLVSKFRVQELSSEH